MSLPKLTDHEREMLEYQLYSRFNCSIRLPSNGYVYGGASFEQYLIEQAKAGEFYAQRWLVVRSAHILTR